MRRGLLLVVTASLACGVANLNASNRDRVLKRATFEMNCSADQLQVAVLDAGRYGGDNAWGVRGCGQQAAYVLLSGGQIVQNSEAAQAAKPQQR